MDKWQLLAQPSCHQEMFQCMPLTVEINQAQRVEPAKAVSPSSHEKHFTIESLRKDRDLASWKLPFLWKLHEMLDDVEQTGNQHIVSWLEHGRAFRVHRPKSFVQKIVPYYFRQSKYKSFQRQLELYEFTRTPRGPEAGAYSHPKFVRGINTLCLSMSPKKIKGKLSKRNMMAIPNHHQHQYPASFYPSKSIIQHATTRPRTAPSGDTSEWMTKIQRILVTGASLAVQLEEQSRKENAGPLDGDIVYIFGGMPFRYLDLKPEKPESDDDDDEMSVSDTAVL
jgi:hypothetical protein